MPGRPRKNRRKEADEAPAGASHMKRDKGIKPHKVPMCVTQSEMLGQKRENKCGQRKWNKCEQRKGKKWEHFSLDIYFISAPTDIRIAVMARMKLASTNTFTMLIVASMINSLVLTLPSGIAVSVYSVISRLSSWDVGLVCETLLIWLVGLHHAQKSQPPLSASLHV
ncbi:hypothetical protein RHGRI_013965 [Rhododendron griersonianum]|uniref:Uncharacterized protein n=1 Tax=Rhododendron griersonianum TaxID=479676 RepID=A0AAV6K857_9ERIC|nr:hypothetical protein RHGRI_013965 [Rhododendron griersonianum]